jgi:hypothetical protein
MPDFGRSSSHVMVVVGSGRIRLVAAKRKSNSGKLTKELRSDAAVSVSRGLTSVDLGHAHGLLHLTIDSGDFFGSDTTALIKDRD